MTACDLSYLFVPASRPDRITKAIEAGAEAVIIDLEDAVSADDKISALEALLVHWSDYARQAKEKEVTLLLRINATDSQWSAAELSACVTLSINHIVVPKAADVKALADILDRLPDAKLYPLIESAEGFEYLSGVARAQGVVRLLFGSVDLMLDLGISDSGEPLHFYRSSIVLQSRLAGLMPPVDGVCIELNDDEKLTAEVHRARSFGFGAKLLIHPKQITIVQKGFTPSIEEIDWARRVVEAASSGAAVAIDGKMVDRPVVLRAQRLLASRAK